MALFFDLRTKHKKSEISPEILEKQLREAIDQIATVLVGAWPSRFDEIEWPALIWINWMTGFGKHALNLDVWPESKVSKFCEVPGLRLGKLKLLSRSLTAFFFISRSQP